MYLNVLNLIFAIIALRINTNRPSQPFVYMRKIITAESYARGNNHQNVQFYLSLKYWIDLSMRLFSKKMYAIYVRVLGKEEQASGYHVPPSSEYTVCLP
jgi:hypothetical protein